MALWWVSMIQVWFWTVSASNPCSLQSQKIPIPSSCSSEISGSDWTEFRIYPSQSGFRPALPQHFVSLPKLWASSQFQNSYNLSRAPPTGHEATEKGVVFISLWGWYIWASLWVYRFSMLYPILKGMFYWKKGSSLSIFPYFLLISCLFAQDWT